MAQAKKPTNPVFIDPADPPKKEPATKAATPAAGPTPKKRARRRKKEPFSLPVEVTPPGVDPDRLMMTDLESIDPDTGLANEAAHPIMSVGVVAELFFFKTSHWMRLQQKDNKLLYNGKQIEIPRTRYNARFYTLKEVELIAHALAQNGVISGLHAAQVLMAVSALAKIHGYRDDSED
jgi:hypothetical protein